MNMRKSFVELKWDVFWEDMVEGFNFKSAFKVSDHHKDWTLARIARE